MEGEDLINLQAAPSGTDAADWDSLQRRSCAYLQLYVKQDVFSLVASNTEFPHFKSKWDKLKELYGGATGSATIFNLWINLTQARLDDTSPMAPQLAKLNESRVALANASMGVTDTQYCLILLNALPSSYEVLASTILAAGPPSAPVRALSMKKAGAHQDLRPLMRLGPPLLKAPKAKREIIQISLATTARKRGISSLIVVKRKRTIKTRRKKTKDLHLVVVQRLSILM